MDYQILQKPEQGQEPFSQRQHVPLEFTLLSWNLSKKCFRAKWPGFFDLLHQHYPAEFMLFQEFNYRSGYSRRSERLGHFGRSGVERQDRVLYHDKGYHCTLLPNLRQWHRRKAYAGVATLSPISCQGHTAYISRAREPLAFTRKPILASVYQLENGLSLLLVNIHAINFVHTYHFIRQLSQFREILSQHNGPTVVAGDFNSWNNSRIQAIEKMLADSSAAFCEVDFGQHNPHIKRAPKLFQHFFGEHHLDRIYYRSDYLELAHKPQVLHQIDEISFDISDHAPLYVKFRCR